ncbi:MAG: hypothetical protein KDB69_09205 [Acidimicrobiia bacterium]|nr:hypothetical protein [Acidimicrobiia bacterium]
MSSDSTLRALTVELASSAPEPPPMPDLDRRGSQRLAGPRLAVAVALVAVIVPLAVVAVWPTITSRRTVDARTAETSLFQAAGAAHVAIVADDGVVMRGYLWSGSHHGVIITQGFGSDPTDIVALASAAAHEGATVLLYSPRGTGLSEGEPDAALLEPDMRAAVRDLLTRGVDTVTIVAFNHSGTALIDLAADPMPALRDVVAVFPFARYQSLDATDSIGKVAIPITLIGVAYPSPLGPEVVRLGNAAENSTVDIYEHPGQDVPILEATMPKLVELIRQMSR